MPDAAPFVYPTPGLCHFAALHEFEFFFMLPVPAFLRKIEHGGFIFMHD